MKETLDRMATLLSYSIALEASAYPKPGNVHRLHSYPDKRYEDFLIASIVSYKYFRKVIARGLRVSRKRVKTLFCDLLRRSMYEILLFTSNRNTSLGTLLLLMPLGLAIGYISASRQGFTVDELVASTTVLVKKYSTINDSIEYYRVLRRVKPTYLRRTDNTGNYPNIYDKSYRRKLVEKKIRLWDLLVYASRKDVVSRQVVSNYRECVEGKDFLVERICFHRDFNRGVVETFLYLLARNNDTVIVLKHGLETMEYVQTRVSKVLEEILDRRDSGWYKIVSILDQEFYSKNINPGSIADLIACTIFLYLLEEQYTRTRG